MSLWRARLRITSMLSAFAGRAGFDALSPCPFWPGHRNLKNAMELQIP
jgi:hypothetical protein